MPLQHSNYNPDLKAGAVADEGDLAITEGSILVGASTGLGTELDASGDTKILVGNATTITSVAMSGDATMSNAGVVAVTNFVREGETTTAGENLLVADSGKVIFSAGTSSTQTYVLPAAAMGLTYTFILTHADGEILIDQAASEVITITTFAAVGADADTAIVAPAGGTGIKNTAATNVLNDYLTLVSDGVDTWYKVAQSGIWASQ